VSNKNKRINVKNLLPLSFTLPSLNLCRTLRREKKKEEEKITPYPQYNFLYCFKFGSKNTT